jgi:hypothetical protein
MIPNLVALISEAANAPNESEKRKAAMEAENLYRNILMEAKAMGKDPAEIQDQIAQQMAERMQDTQEPEPAPEGDDGPGWGTAALALGAAIPGVGALRGGLGAAKAAMAAGRAAGGIKGFAKGGKDAYMALTKQAFARFGKKGMPVPAAGDKSFKSLAGRGDEAEVEKIMEMLRQRRRQATPEEDIKWLYGQGD